MTTVTTNSCNDLNMAGFSILNINTLSSSFINFSSMTLSNLNMNSGTISDVTTIYVQNFTGTLNLIGNNIINTNNITATLVTASTIVANNFSGTLLGSATSLSPGAIINGQLFDGTTAITITVSSSAATVYSSSLLGDTLAVNVVYSSLQTVGNLTSLTMAGTLNLEGNNIVNIGILTSTVVTTSTLSTNNITATVVAINTITNNILSSSTITTGYITATIGTIQNFTSTTITANNITATLITGNFSSDEFISYPTATLSPNVINSIVASGNRYSSWGTRIGGSLINNTIGLGTALNNTGDIVTSGYFSPPQIWIYNNGGIITAYTLTLVGNQAAYLAKYNSVGTAQWAAKIGSVNAVDSQNICINEQGNIFVTGFYTGAQLFVYNSSGSSVITINGSSAIDIYITMYNSNGFGQWASRISGLTTNDYGIGIACNISDVVLTGYYSGSPINVYNKDNSPVLTLNNSGGNDVFIARYDSYGYVQWASRVSSVFSDYGGTVDMSTNGDIVLAGYTGTNSTLWIYQPGGTTVQFTLTSSGDYDAFIVKYNSAGTPQWVTKVGGTGADGGETLYIGTSINNLGDIVATGYYTSSPLWVYNAGGTIIAFTLDNLGTNDAFIVKWNSSGIAQWATKISGITDDYGRGISMNDFGDIVVTGHYNSSPLYIYNAGGTIIAFSLENSNYIDTFVVKWNAIGQAQWASRISTNTIYNSFGISIDINECNEIIVIGRYSNQLVVYNPSGTTGITLLGTGLAEEFIVKYVDEMSANLPNATENGQEKSIKSLTTKVNVIPSGYINNSTASIAVYNGENLNLIWDSTNSNWNVKENTRIPQTNELVLRANGLEALKISATGIVTRPYNCAFLVTYNTATAIAAPTGTNSLLFPYKIYDIGNNFNSGVFTVPVTGLYHLYGSILMTGGGTNNARLQIFKNSRLFILPMRLMPSEQAVSGRNTSSPFAVTTLLNANDRITLILLLDTIFGTTVLGIDGTASSALLTYFGACLLS